MFPYWGLRVELINGGTPKFDFAADPHRVRGGFPLRGMCPLRDCVAPRGRDRAGCSPRTGLKKSPRVGDRWVHAVHVHVGLRGIVVPGCVRVHNRRGASAPRDGKVRSGCTTPGARRYQRSGRSAERGFGAPGGKQCQNGSRAPRWRDIA